MNADEPMPAGEHMLSWYLSSNTALWSLSGCIVILKTIRQLSPAKTWRPDRPSRWNSRKSNTRNNRIWYIWKSGTTGPARFKGCWKLYRDVKMCTCRWAASKILTQLSSSHQQGVPTSPFCLCGHPLPCCSQRGIFIEYTCICFADFFPEGES